MRRFGLLLVSLLAPALVIACTADEVETGSETTEISAPVAADLAAEAARVTDLLTEGKWAEIRTGFDETLTNSLSEAGLADAWQKVVGAFGAYTSRGEPKLVPKDEADEVYDTPMTFELAEMKSRIAFDDDGKITGLFILKPEVP